MGKKGSKRKTRWRTLSIGAPPGEEDEKERLQKGYVKDQENGTRAHSFDRNDQGGCKPRRIGSGGSSSYAAAANRSHKDESSGSPSQPKIIFNEDEYTRITTPRQDMLFKKGYLSRKKPWAGNASTSATPSTTESQSASHSTADGSETAEDQLLDRDYGNGECPPMVDNGAQLGYGSFYDYASGYCYEYPVMLVGPAPVPAQIGPSVLAAVPCGPVPLRPIEWINPAFVTKLSGQPYCVMDYQSNQSTESVPVVEEQENTLLAVENINGTCNESRTGSASCSGSVAGEVEEQHVEANVAKESQVEDQQAEEQVEEQYVDEQYVEEQPLENGMNGGPYLEPVLVQQPVHVSHMIPALSQPYMYPGHYMFGPPLINVNGVTIQGGPMIRTTDVATTSAACTKRRKKKKRRKQRRLALGNTEDEEEGEYSSECDTGLPSSRLSWTECSTSMTSTTMAGNQLLNPECQEFQLRPVVESNTSLSVVATNGNTPTSEESSAINQSSTLSSDAAYVDKNNEPCNGVVADDTKNQEDEVATDSNSDQVAGSPSEKSPTASLEAINSDDDPKRLTNCLAGKEVEEEKSLSTNEIAEVIEIETPPSTDVDKPASDSSSANESSRDETNGVEEETLVNGKIDSDSSKEETQVASVSSRPSSRCSDERTRSRSVTPKTVVTENAEAREENHEPLSNSKPSSGVPKRKYSAKGTKFVREPTPGPDLNSNAEQETEKLAGQDLTQSLESMDLSNYSLSKSDSAFELCAKTENQVSDNYASKNTCNHLRKEDPIEASNEDSGFESQTRLSDYPITEAVTQWLSRVNSPDIFITSTVLVDSDEMENKNEVNEEPPKNLQGNPMPALSVNSGADDATASSRSTSYGEFARISNVKGQEQLEGNKEGGTRKKRDAKRRSGERRRVRHVDGNKLENEAVSSSDSCSQQKHPVGAARKKNPSKQQDVGDVCEFTEKDSVAGMRVASSSRVDSKRVNARRTKRQGRSNRDPTNNTDAKVRRVEGDQNEDEGIVEDTMNVRTFEKGEIVEDTMNVRTFEKGEIVVSEEGKLLTTSTYEPILRNSCDASAVIKTVNRNETTKETARKTEEKNKRSSSGEEENASEEISLDSIEEPDVLECWEAETIEPVITPKKMQCQGVSCEGEAAEEDNNESEQINLEYVQKYYRLARESATSSIEEDISGSKMNVDSFPSKSVPNNNEQTEENRTQKGDKNDIPIDEAFEVYESCYTGKSPFIGIDSKVFKSRTLYGQEGEYPIQCKAVCCSLQ